VEVFHFHGSRQCSPCIAVGALATGLPVIAALILLVKSIGALGSIMNKIQVLEGGARKGAGWVFIAAGVYLMKEVAGI